MSALIECICCRECFKPSKIKHSTIKIENNDDCDELMQFAEQSGAEFDCPECGERQYLSDCELY